MDLVQLRLAGGRCRVAMGSSFPLDLGQCELGAFVCGEMRISQQCSVSRDLSEESKFNINSPLILISLIF